MKRTARVGIWAASVSLAIVSLTAHGSAWAKEYLVVDTKPNLLFLVDTQARKVVRQYKIPGEGPPLYSLCVPPDGRVAYVTTERAGALSGIDLESGKQVFRAEFSTPDTQVKSLAAMACSRDGKELFVQQSVTKLLPGEYQVQPSRIAVYETNAGLEAKPARTFDTPRRIILLLPSVDGKIIYGLGWDLYAFDAASGKILKTYKLLHWDRPNSGPPDLLNVWPGYEQSDVFTSVYYYSRTDLPQDNPESQKTGIMTLDLRTGEVRLTDFENTPAGALEASIFATVLNPKNPNEVFAVFTTLSRISLGNPPKRQQQIKLDRTYYHLNISGDGNEVYLGGGMSDIAVYSTKTMKKLADIKLPGAGDQGTNLAWIVHRP